MSTISTEERREVARRLRELSWCAVTSDSTYEVLTSILHVGRSDFSDELFASLADLIDPKCDRAALLALAEDVTEAAAMATVMDSSTGAKLLADLLRDIARSIREALGVEP